VICAEAIDEMVIEAKTKHSKRYVLYIFQIVKRINRKSRQWENENIPSLKNKKFLFQ